MHTTTQITPRELRITRSGRDLYWSHDDDLRILVSTNRMSSSRIPRSCEGALVLIALDVDGGHDEVIVSTGPGQDEGAALSSRSLSDEVAAALTRVMAAPLRDGQPGDALAAKQDEVAEEGRACSPRPAPAWCDAQTDITHNRGPKTHPDDAGTDYLRTLDRWDRDEPGRDPLTVALESTRHDDGDDCPDVATVYELGESGLVDRLTLEASDARRLAAALTRAADLIEGTSS